MLCYLCRPFLYFLEGKYLWQEITGAKASKPDMVESGNYIAKVLPIPFIGSNAHASSYFTVLLWCISSYCKLFYSIFNYCFVYLLKVTSFQLFIWWVLWWQLNGNPSWVSVFDVLIVRQTEQNQMVASCSVLSALTI